MTAIRESNGTAEIVEVGLPDESRAGRLRGLGAEVRALRTERGLTMAALAGQLGVSTSLISQIERGITAPSLEVLWGLARALGISIGVFFQDDAPAPATSAGPSKAIVVRAGKRKKLGLPNALTYELLSPDLNRQIEFIWVRFEPGDESPVEPYTHPGEEQMVVVEGEMQFWVEGETFVLGAGDAITIDSALPHRAMNRSDRPALVIAAISPPSF
jgi:transcriptional regulator with XRE-family HTH domain